MRFQITLFAALISILLAACGGDPGGHNPYDGAWMMSYDTGIANTSTTSCTIPTASVTLTNGAGTTTQVETCLYTTTVVNTGGSAVYSTSSSTTQLLTAVNVSGQGIKAIVNGNTYSGQCVSPNGCSAQADSGTGSMTLIR